MLGGGHHGSVDASLQDSCRLSGTCCFPCRAEPSSGRRGTQHCAPLPTSGLAVTHRACGEADTGSLPWSKSWHLPMPQFPLVWWKAAAFCCPTHALASPFALWYGTHTKRRPDLDPQQLQGLLAFLGSPRDAGGHGRRSKQQGSSRESPCLKGFQRAAETGRLFWSALRSHCGTRSVLGSPEPEFQHAPRS